MVVNKLTISLRKRNKFVKTSLKAGVVNAFSNQKIELSDKNKKVYNNLGDYPDVVSSFLVKKMITNTKRGVRIAWLTNRKAAWCFMTSSFNKRDFFT